MTPEQAKQYLIDKGQGTSLWCSTQSGAVEVEFDAIQAAQAELQSAYCQRMAVVMTGLVDSHSPKDSRECLDAAERCISQFALASAWLASQTDAALHPSA